MGKTAKRRDRSWYKYHDGKQRKTKFTTTKTVEQPKQAPVSDSVMLDITKDRDPQFKRNQRGDIIYASRYIGDEKFEYWIDYDACSRPIVYCDSRGYEWKCKYNTKGNIAEYWDNRGYYERYYYYANNLVIRKDSFGVEIKKHVSRDRFITRETFLKAD